jgi:hypothetical protein
LITAEHSGKHQDPDPQNPKRDRAQAPDDESPDEIRSLTSEPPADNKFGDNFRDYPDQQKLQPNQDFSSRPDTHNARPLSRQLSQRRTSSSRLERTRHSSEAKLRTARRFNLPG